MVTRLDAVEIVHNIQNSILHAIKVAALIIYLIEHSILPALTCGGAECAARGARFELIAIVRVFLDESHDLCERRSIR